jgi:hypothetical protein
MKPPLGMIACSRARRSLEQGVSEQQKGLTALCRRGRVQALLDLVNASLQLADQHAVADN